MPRAASSSDRDSGSGRRPHRRRRQARGEPAISAIASRGQERPAGAAEDASGLGREVQAVGEHARSAARRRSPSRRRAGPRGRRTRRRTPGRGSRRSPRAAARRSSSASSSLTSSIHAARRLVERDDGGCRPARRGRRARSRAPAAASRRRRGPADGAARRRPGRARRPPASRRARPPRDGVVDQVVGRVLEQQRDAPSRASRAARRRGETRGDAQQRRFSGAVAAHQRDALAGRDASETPRRIAGPSGISRQQRVQGRAPRCASDRGRPRRSRATRARWRALAVSHSRKPPPPRPGQQPGIAQRPARAALDHREPARRPTPASSRAPGGRERRRATGAPSRGTRSATRRRRCGRPRARATRSANAEAPLEPMLGEEDRQLGSRRAGAAAGRSARRRQPDRAARSAHQARGPMGGAASVAPSATRCSSPPESSLGRPLQQRVDRQRQRDLLDRAGDRRGG